MTNKNRDMTKAHEARAKRLLDKAALREELDGGAIIYPDSPPGVGWVLVHPGGRKSYMKDREAVIDLWVNKWRQNYLVTPMAA